MKTLLLASLLSGLLPAAQLVVNPDFESTPFPAGWSHDGSLAVAGLGGSATAARLPWPTLAKLSQTVATPATDFTFETSLSFAGSNEEQSFAVVLETSTGAAGSKGVRRPEGDCFDK